MTAGSLIDLLKYFPKDSPVKVLSADGVEELDFARPTITRFNAGSPDEFVAINVVVKP
jgi:hypothetical protein